jgi:hypothetical protein
MLSKHSLEFVSGIDAIDRSFGGIMMRTDGVRPHWPAAIWTLPACSTTSPEAAFSSTDLTPQGVTAGGV